MRPLYTASHRVAECRQRPTCASVFGLHLGKRGACAQSARWASADTGCPNLSPPLRQQHGAGLDAAETRRLFVPGVAPRGCGYRGHLRRFEPARAAAPARRLRFPTSRSAVCAALRRRRCAEGNRCTAYVAAASTIAVMILFMNFSRRCESRRRTAYGPRWRDRIRGRRNPRVGAHRRVVAKLQRQSPAIARTAVAASHVECVPSR